MAIIACPECGGNVSDLAAACPHCGYLIRGDLPVATRPRSTVTTQRTAKRYKGHRLLANLAALVGVGLMAAGFFSVLNYQSGQPQIRLTPEGKALLIAGGCVFAFAWVWYALASLAAWWQHG